MSLRRFKVDPPLRAGGIVVSGEEARHLRVVLRARPGERFAVFDGCGAEAEAEVVEVGRDGVRARIAGSIDRRPDLPCRVEVACALPRAGAADDVVRVAVEVGARAIRPLVTERGVWRADDPGEGRRGERFERAAVAALKQSGLSWMPDLLPPSGVDDLVLEPGVLALVGSAAPQAAPIGRVLAAWQPGGRATVIVGPEGGLSEREEAALVSKGAVLVRAAPGTLRVETAVVVLVSHVLSRVG